MFIPREKLSKKARKALDNSRRRTWGEMSPVTRRPDNPRAYKRKKVQYGRDDRQTEPFLFVTGPPRQMASEKAWRF